MISAFKAVDKKVTKIVIVFYEENNMSEQEPELVKRLDEQITRWAKSVYSEVPDQFARKVRRTNKNNT